MDKIHGVTTQMKPLQHFVHLISFVFEHFTKWNFGYICCILTFATYGNERVKLVLTCSLISCCICVNSSFQFDLLWIIAESMLRVSFIWRLMRKICPYFPSLFFRKFTRQVYSRYSLSRGFVSQIMLYYWKFRHILLQREKSREAIELASIFLLLFLCCWSINVIRISR